MGDDSFGLLDYNGLRNFWSKLKEILSLKITGVGVSKIVSLTQEQYDALSDAQKNDGSVYITDDAFDPITDEEIEALFPNETEEV